MLTRLYTTIGGTCLTSFMYRYFKVMTNVTFICEYKQQLLNTVVKL
jgi:hypothetical protein